VSAIDLTGQRFGLLTAVERVHYSDRASSSYWRCACDCGNEAVIHSYHLRLGIRPSCGCSRSTHGHSKRTEYAVWNGMIQRCTNPRYPEFHNYGGRGIKVCDRWLNGEDGKFGIECFLVDMGPRPAGLSIDRIENDGNYEPGNCRWATQATQCQNTRRTRLNAQKVSEIRAFGDGANCAEIARNMGVSQSTVWKIRAGHSWRAQA
jgi:hypothetical protein